MREHDSYQPTRRGTSGFTAFLIGGLIGGTIALLYAPRSGRETREYLLSEGQETADRLMRSVREAQERILASIEDAQARLEVMNRDARERLTQLQAIAQERLQLVTGIMQITRKMGQSVHGIGITRFEEKRDDEHRQ